MPAGTLSSRNTKKKRTSPLRKSGLVRPRTSCQRQTQALENLSEPIPFVPHPAFRRKNVESELHRLVPLPKHLPAQETEPQPGLTFVAGFVSQPLLTPADEQSLFAWMNYYRFRAEERRRSALASRSPRRFLAGISRDLELANELRNRIVSSNLRLVVSLAKKLTASLDQMSELISEGVVPLIRAVELFDISLGNRFSTYATWAVRNQMLRLLKRSRTSADRWGQPLELILDSLAAPTTQAESEMPVDASVRQVHHLLAKLPDRERSVLQARFGVEGEPAGQSLADVAEKVGLSKERVRQLVLKSLDELRNQLATSHFPRG